jgi:hypothetical protein
MAFTNLGYFNSSSPGAPTLRPVNGDLNALLHYALTTISNWTRLYHDGTNFRDVWQPAAGGASPVLICKHNSADSGDARLAVVRMAESASSTTSYTDAFPTVLQVADTSCNWLVSNTSGTTARDYHCVVWETGIVLAVRVTGQTDVWEIYLAGKAFSRFSSTDDPYPWMIGVRASTNTSTINAIANATCNPTIPSSGYYRFFAMRNPAGSLKSCCLHPEGRGSGLGNAGTNPASAGASYLGTIDRAKVRFHDMNSTTTALGTPPILSRLCFPQVYVGEHSFYSGVTESDSVSDGSHSLQLLRNGTSVAWLLETGNNFTGYPAG